MTDTSQEILSRGIIRPTPFYLVIQSNKNVVVPHQSEENINYYTFCVPSGIDIKIHVGIDPKYRPFQETDLWYSVDGWYGSKRFRYNEPHRIMYKTPMTFTGVETKPLSCTDKFIIYHAVPGENSDALFPAPRLYLKLHLYQRCSDRNDINDTIPGIKYGLGDTSLSQYDQFKLQTTVELHLNFTCNQPEAERLHNNNKYLLLKYLETGENISTLLDKIKTARSTLNLLEPKLQQIQDDQYNLLQKQATLTKLVSYLSDNQSATSSPVTHTVNDDTGIDSASDSSTDSDSLTEIQVNLATDYSTDIDSPTEIQGNLATDSSTDIDSPTEIQGNLATDTDNDTDNNTDP
jgi:hypothetical protein